MENLKEVNLSIRVNANKEQVWDLLFNKFGEVTIFNPIIEGSHYTTGPQGEVGCERQCDLDAKNSIHEKISARRGNDGFDIEIIKGGLPMVKTANATFELVQLNRYQTRVNFTMRFNSKPAFMAGMMKMMMKKMLFKMLIGLKYHLETNKPVTKENISGIIKNYKKLHDNEAFSGVKLATAV